MPSSTAQMKTVRVPLVHAHVEVPYLLASRTNGSTAQLVSQSRLQETQDIVSGVLLANARQTMEHLATPCMVEHQPVEQIAGDTWILQMEERSFGLKAWTQGLLLIPVQVPLVITGRTVATPKKRLVA